jgi:hypothetical protein
MESALLLDIVIRKSAPILELLSGEDQALLVRGNSLLILNLGLDIIDRIGGLDLERDGLASEAIGVEVSVSCYISAKCPLRLEDDDVDGDNL